MRYLAAVVCAALFVSVVSSVPAATPSTAWPSFRGSDRTAVSTETGLLQKWPDGGPPLLWDATGAGRGYASLAIADRYIITLGDGSSQVADDPDEYLLAFDRDTGKPLWKLKSGPAWTKGQPTWQSSRSTPTIEGDRVYALTADGELICAETASGKELWRKNLPNDFGGKKGDGWGYSESPLVDGPHLICTPGGEEATMVALDKLTGDLVWKTVRAGDRGAGHASIVISEVGGTRIYVQTTASGALGVRAKDGKLLWSYEIDKTTAVIPTPIVRGDLVFFAAGYKRGGALLKQVIGSGGEITVEEIYGLKPSLANKHGGIVLVGDYLYGCADDQSIIFCADLMTGEERWKSRGAGKSSASIAAADGCLYIHYADGTMELVKASPEEFQSLGSFTIPDTGERPSWAHPVILDGKLYLREQDHLLCYDVRAK